MGSNFYMEHTLTVKVENKAQNKFGNELLCVLEEISSTEKFNKNKLFHK